MLSKELKTMFKTVAKIWQNHKRSDNLQTKHSFALRVLGQPSKIIGEGSGLETLISNIIADTFFSSRRQRCIFSILERPGGSD
jgi:hypothetical protein